jgi:hypothetical protein
MHAMNDLNTELHGLEGRAVNNQGSIGEFVPDELVIAFGPLGRIAAGASMRHAHGKKADSEAH